MENKKTIEGEISKRETQKEKGRERVTERERERVTERGR